MIRTHCTRFPPSFFFGGISPWSSTGSPKRKNLVTIGWNCLVQIRRIHTCLLGDKHIWLVVSFPLKNMSSSLGMMTFPTEWKVIKFHGSKPPTRYTNMIKHAYQSPGIWADPALFSSCVVHGRAQCSQAGSKQVHCCNATEALLNHSMFEWACAKWKNWVNLPQHALCYWRAALWCHSAADVSWRKPNSACWQKGCPTQNNHSKP